MNQHLRRITTITAILAACFLGRAAWAAGPAAVAPQPGFLRSEFVFDHPPTPECHASTIVEAGGGLVAAWFGGTEEKAPDVGIWVARRDGQGWSAPVEVLNGVRPDGPRLPCWNPVLAAPAGGPLLLFSKIGPNPSHWWGVVMTSADGGKTWSPPRRLPDGILGPIKDKPITLAGGVLLCPSSTEEPGWKLHFERTADLGQTWERTAAVGDPLRLGAIQPTVLVHPGGRLQALCRTRKAVIGESWSTDGGKTWSDLAATKLPNPNSGIDAVTLADGRHLLVYNHTTSGRSPLNVAVSQDGRAWDAALVLEDQPGEYSYPAVVQSADGLVHVTYTWDRKRIRHVVLDPAKLASRAMPDGRWPAAKP